MARPRIFISSTYFDLRVVRADIERFIKDIGYEPVLFERGHVAYSRDEALESDCYREISTCDILVAIIGGRYGSQSRDEKHSITHRELKTAIEEGKQIYVFVEKAVHSEYETYRANKEVVGFKPVSVSDVKVFQLIEEIYALPVGNPVEPFEVSEDITHFLKEQWAGLFEKMLQESARQKEVSLIEDLKNTADTLKQLVKVLSETTTQGDATIVKDILLSTHPVFGLIKKLANIPYRVAFHNLRELNALFQQRGLIEDKETPYDDCYDWDHKKDRYGIKIKKHVFGEDGQLKVFSPQDWKDSWIQRYDIPDTSELDDEIPF